jgi:hypothetical protein
MENINMKIRVNAMKSTWGLTIDVEPTDTIYSIMQKIKEEKNIPIDSQKFVFAGEPLDPKKSLQDYKIKEDSVLHIDIAISSEKQNYDIPPDNPEDDPSSNNINDLSSVKLCF